MQTKLVSIYKAFALSLAFIMRFTATRKWPIAPINKARFIRRTLHEPNLIIWFGACKDRRMNQLGSTDMYLGRPAVLFDCASRIERQKFDFDSYVELYMCRTKCIHA